MKEEQTIQRLNKVFEKIKWIDDNRWNSFDDSTNHNLINFSTGLSNSEKLLVHWLCYISERQMSFSLIWDKAGFVYSDIVKKYKETDSPEKLFDLNSEDCFLKENDNKIAFFSTSKVDDKNLLINDYDYQAGDIVKFTPRYYPSDVKSILQTLMILQNYDKNILKYIANIIDVYNKKDFLKHVAFSLYLLTYYEIKQPNKEELKNNYSKIKNEVKINMKHVTEIFNDIDTYNKEFKLFFNGKRYTQKRMWCSLRDFVKSNEFKTYVLNGFSEINRRDLKKFWEKIDDEMLSHLELPGDVWNNNSKFRKCLFSDVDVKYDKNSSKFIRKVYNKYKPKKGYPEMFDVTFDFVPRMCQNNMCNVCIFNTQSSIFSNENNLDKLCVKNETKYCPILAVSCGYKIKCNINNCILVKTK